EPELMDTADQVKAYAEADFSESNQGFVDYLLAEPAVIELLQIQGRLIDLGSGPGDICLRLARALPGWTILGIDAGQNMLATARHAAQSSAMGSQIEFRHSYLPDSTLPARHYDLIVSNSLLHHLPDPNTLWQTIANIARPGAWVQVMDLDRPADNPQAQALVDEYASDAPDILRSDFFNSLKAAWTAHEVQDQIEAAGLTLQVKRVSDRHWLASGSVGH
ncbi:MAG: class I SAM-dependent methyltransferase, partial [Pseudomonadota bacterium]